MRAASDRRDKRHCHAPIYGWMQANVQAALPRTHIWMDASEHASRLMGSQNSGRLTKTTLSYQLSAAQRLEGSSQHESSEIAPCSASLRRRDDVVTTSISI